MLEANSSIRKSSRSSLLVLFVLLAAKVAAATELAISVDVDIPHYPEQKPIVFTYSETLPIFAKLTGNLELGTYLQMCGGMNSFEPPPQSMATLVRATKRYHHIDALLGLKPYTTTYVLKFNTEKNDAQMAVW